MNGANEIKICKMQTTIPRSMQESIVQKLKDNFGQPAKLDQMYTKYRHQKRLMVTMTIDEPAAQTTQTHTITTLGEIQHNPSNVLIQQAVVSQTSGDAHDFANYLGFKPGHTWIEKGNLFTQDAVKIKIFDVYNFNGELIDEENIVVSIEIISQITTAQIDNACKRVSDIYRNLFANRQAFVPEKQLLRA
ncbi:hypothetical protein TRFO_42261 [Tritrichomonas foetus]|uniref:Mediator of RNA polymerase II transcription subunit 18 n=1 Tax=Tritrichomonas foetus TaxID=1144522 RepID=A0A1J4KXD1_9EUKA|nr:hypothetical protein TRFO_42261 [Tritrichomonas foetus]|eukprot:OHT15834.1 hypothetical protein TRFO_42261 [Tritrichomonas foetus]